MGLLSSVTIGGLTTSYDYNYLNQRVRKTRSTGVQTLYYYNTDGILTLESSNTSNVPQAAYFYDDAAKPVAVLYAANGPYNATAQDKLVYLHTDHLGAVRRASDSDFSLSFSQRQVWRWESDPFGTTAPLQDPDGNGVPTVINLRFPGQYYDAESGLHYNGHRYYDPKMGRYISSDPIGLSGGMNTYAYVGNNPLNYFDTNGLCPWCAAAALLVGAEGLNVYLESHSDAHNPCPADAPDCVRSSAAGMDLAAGVVGTGSNALRNIGSTSSRTLPEPIISSASVPPREITVSRSSYPQSAQHIDDAIAAGHPSIRS